MATKIAVHRDANMEKLTNLSFVACAAYYDGEGVRVVGELVSSNSLPIPDYREVQVSVYSEDGNILGRNSIEWPEFQIRQTFEVEVAELPGIPSRVNVFPSK